MNPYDPPKTQVASPKQKSDDASAFWFAGGYIVAYWIPLFLFFPAMNVGAAEAIIASIAAWFIYNLLSSFITAGIFGLKRPWWLLVFSALVLSMSHHAIYLAGISIETTRFSTWCIALACCMTVCILSEVIIGTRTPT